MCYERGEIRDDASDISEHTRDLLKAKLTVAKFKSILSKSKKVVDREKMRQDASRKYAKIWITNARKKRKTRTEAVALKWTSHTKETTHRASVVPPIDVKPVDGSQKLPDGVGDSDQQTKDSTFPPLKSQQGKVPPPIDVKVINETEKTIAKSKGKPNETKTKFPAVPQKQSAIPAPSADDPKSDLLDSPKKKEDENPPPGGTVTPKNVAVVVDNKPITAKSQAMRPVSAKPKLIRPSSAERKPENRPGTAKVRPTTAKKRTEPSTTTQRPPTAAKRSDPTTASQRPTTAGKRPTTAATRPTTAKTRTAQKK